MKRRIYLSIGSGVLLLAVGLTGTVFLTSAAEAMAGRANKRIEGMWAVQVTIHDCQSGQDLRTFPALLTFAQGGTLAGTTAGAPPSITTAHVGTWEFEGGRTFTATTSAFLFRADGTLLGTQTLTQTIEIGDDPDTFTSTATSTVVDPNGNQVMATCATAVAHRVG
jgi:hypothetical protein